MTQTAVQPVSSSTPSACLRLAVIGGGVTGLAAVHRLTELAAQAAIPVQITLFETSSRVGGAFGTQRVGDYRIERGADSFITNKPWGVDLVRRLGLEDRLISTNAAYRKSLILSRGRPLPTPEGFNLVAPARLTPVLQSPLLSWPGKLRLLAEPFIPRRTATADESVADFVRRRLGQEALDRIVQPLVGGIYTSDPERLSTQATLERFAVMERRAGSLYRGLRKSAKKLKEGDSASGARYGLFASFPNGMQELLDALEAVARRAADVRLSCPVLRLRRSDSVTSNESSAPHPRPRSPEYRGEGSVIVDGAWTVTTASGDQTFDGVVCALSAPTAAQLLQPVDDQCAEAIASIECASSAIVVTGHLLSDVEHPLDAFGLVIPHREKRRILATSFLSRKFDDRAPAGRVCLRTFVGGAMQPEEYERTDEQIIATVLEELRSILGVKGTPDFAVVARYPQGMPQFHVGHLDRVAEIRKQAARLSGFALAGNYLDGVGVPDCIHSGEQAAELLFQNCTVRSVEN